MGRQLSLGERRAVWETLLLRSKNGKLSSGEQMRVACEFDIGRMTVKRIWDRGTQSMGPRVAAVMILQREGKNDYRLGHLKKDFLLRHVGWLPDSLPCDELVYDDVMELLRKHDVSVVATPPPPPPQPDVHNDLEWLS